MLWPFAIAALVFWFVAFTGRRRGNLATMRELIEHHGVLCRRIAAERLRLPSLEGAEHAAALGRLEVLDRAREKAEQRAVRLRETLLKAGFSLDEAQLTTVEDAEAALKAERGPRA